MSKITAVILAAGRGSRMNDATKDRPKCLLYLAGKPLLHWQLEALRYAGIPRIVVVRGYLKEMLTGDFETLENSDWASSNMVRTLLCALSEVGDSTLLVSYADIVYRAGHVEKLIQAEGDFCITYDRQWEDLWRLRNENPLDDAETFKVQDNTLTEIGLKPKSLVDIQGQYMGLLKFSPAGRKQLQEYLAQLSEEEINHLDMTSLLNRLLQSGITVHTCSVSGGWCECDTEQDIAAYEQRLHAGNWEHDWR